jgi:hypothetical protein
MEQTLITIAINYEPEDESAVADAIAAIHGGSAETIKDAVDSIAAALEAIPGAHVPHWSSPKTDNWVTQNETISSLYQQIDNHVCQCCHQIAVAPAGVAGFEPGVCPPLHNCAACADQII